MRIQAAQAVGEYIQTFADGKRSCIDMEINLEQSSFSPTLPLSDESPFSPSVSAISLHRLHTMALIFLEESLWKQIMENGIVVPSCQSLMFDQTSMTPFPT